VKYAVQTLTREEWQPLAETAHSALFGTHRPASLDRSTYTIFLTGDNDAPLAYVQVRETDADTVYWQYGGVFADVPRTQTLALYKALLGAQRSRGTKRLVTGVSNKNNVYLKTCMKMGFTIIGTRFDGTELYVELSLEL